MGIVVYVGITKNMRKRVKDHKSDKLCAFKGVVEYFAVETRADAEMLETYLINHYGTAQFFNIQKTKDKRGNVTFLDGVIFPWKAWSKGSSPDVFTVKGFIDSQIDLKNKEIHQLNREMISQQEKFNSEIDSLREMLDKANDKIQEMSGIEWYKKHASMAVSNSIFKSMKRKTAS